MDLILQPVAQLAAALEGARETDAKFNGGGRYAAEVWQNLGGDARLATEAEKIAGALAKIPEGPNRRVATAYFEDNRARPALTEQERGYFAGAGQSPSEIVNAAHQFASATDAFKAWLAKSVDEPSYSPFASARDIDKAASAAGLRVEWDLYGGTAKMDSVTLDRADPVDVNVFQPGDKVVTQDGKDFTVLRQDGWQVSLKGKAGAVHANHLKLASGAKPKRVAMDGCGADGVEDDFDPEAEFAAMPEAEGEAEEARQ